MSIRLALLAASLLACTAEPPRVVSVRAPEDTRDTAGPYVVQAEVRGALGDSELVACWSTDGERFLAAPTRAREGREDLRSAEVPGQPAGTTVSVLLAFVPADDLCPPAADAAAPLVSFRVLGSSLACEVDSDCRLGLEACIGSTCRELSGDCAEGGACPGGFTCDERLDPPVCVIPARACAGDAECPALERCDVARGECEARP